VPRVIIKDSTASLGRAAAALPWAGALAKNVKPDPDGLPPHEVKDLHYGDVLFYFYQDDYFDSITRLLAAQQLERLPHTEGRGRAVAGRLYLSLGEHVEAGKIFEALLNSNVSEAVRNRAWFFWARSGINAVTCTNPSARLHQVSDKIQPRISAERYMLLAQLMLRRTALRRCHRGLELLARSPRLDGVRPIQSRCGVGPGGRLPEAITYLDRVGRMETKSEELLSLRTRPTWPWDLRCCRRSAQPMPVPSWSACVSTARTPARRCWASAGRMPALGEFKHALVPWLALRKRNLLDSAVQESYLTVPYAYNQLGATGQAAEFYNSAIDSFDAEMQHIDESIEQIRSGHLLDRLLNDDKKTRTDLVLAADDLPDAPESRYLYQLLASNEFQEGLKNYRELGFMSRNIDDWRDDVSAFDDMLDTRQTAYNNGCRRRMPSWRRPIWTP
jgi:tetratricopeptide (TPR) repeat protein